MTYRVVVAARMPPRRMTYHRRVTLMIVNLSQTSRERCPAELVAVIRSVQRPALSLVERKALAGKRTLFAPLCPAIANLCRIAVRLQACL